MKKIILIGIVVALAAFFRLYDLKNAPPGLYPDEAMNGNNALEVAATGDYKIFYPENNGREGLFINIQAVFLKFLPREPWALRLPSALFGILTVLGIYLLTRELFKNFRNQKDDEKTDKQAELVAFLAFFFAAVSFWQINFSRIGFRAIMAPFFLVFSLYFFLRVIRKRRDFKSSAFNSLFWCAAIGGVFMGLGFYSYIAYRAMPALFLLLIPFFYKEKKFWQATTIFVITGIIVALPLGIYFIQNTQDFLGRTAQVSVFSSPTPVKDLAINIIKTAGMFNFIGDGNARHNYAGKPELEFITGILFIVGIIISVRRFYKGEKIAPAVLFFWLILAALPVVISNEGMPHSLRAILMAPPVFILAGMGGEKILNNFKNEKAKAFFMAAFLAYLISSANNEYFMRFAKSQETADAFSKNYVEIGRELNALPKEKLKYVIVNSGGTNVRGVPMPAQTIMFITDTFSREKQKEKNIYYVLPDDTAKEGESFLAPEGSFVVEI